MIKCLQIFKRWR